MIVSYKDADRLIHAISDENRNSTEKNVVVFHCITDVESVCACKLLDRILGNLKFSCSFYPVDTHSELAESAQRVLNGSEDIRTVILINCGATRYANDYIDPQKTENVRFLVFDSHRPIDPRYDDDDDASAVLVLDDTEVPGGLHAVPMPEAWIAALWLGHGPEGLRQLEEQAEEEEEEEEQEEGSHGKRVRHSPEGFGSMTTKQKLRELRRASREMEEYRALGSSYGTPSVILLLRLAETLSLRLTNEILWPTIVGITDHYIYNRCSSEHYEQWRQHLKDHVMVCDANAKHLAANGNSDRISFSNVRGANGGIPEVAIRPGKDWRLVLLRHWNLLDALMYSPYVAARLQTYRQGGVQKLLNLLASMGVNKRAAQDPFRGMHHDLKDALDGKLEREINNTNMVWSELQFDSFTVYYAYGFAMSASDAVHALTGLLCMQPNINQKIAETSVQRFWSAMEALDFVQNGDQLKFGMDQAKVLHKAVLQDGGQLITSNGLVAHAHAHMQELNVDKATCSNKEIFQQHPLALLRLATFVRDGADVARVGKRVKMPIVVVGPGDADGYCRVVGIRQGLAKDQLQFNRFGYTFHKVLEEDPEQQVIIPQPDSHGFDPAMVGILRDSVDSFLFKLKVILRDEHKKEMAAQKELQQQAELQRQERELAAAAAGARAAAEERQGEDDTGSQS